MKTKIFIFSCTLMLIASCTPPTNNNNTDDSSPGVDEYFRTDINGYHWEENDDEYIAAVLSNLGTGSVYGLSTTSVADSTHFFYSVPYFYSNDTTWNLSSMPADMHFQFHTDSIYTGVTSGNLHIVRSTVNSLEVFTGTFNYIGTTIITNSPANFTNGEFVIARLL